MPGLLELTVRIGTTLAVLLGVGWGLLRLVRGPLARRGCQVAVLARQQLAKGSAVAVVRVADRALVLGVTDHRVSLLTETDLDLVLEPVPDPPDVVAPWLAPDGPDGPGGRGLLSGWPGHQVGGLRGGSLLTAQTWRQTMTALRARAARR